MCMNRGGTWHNVYAAPLLLVPPVPSITLSGMISRISVMSSLVIGMGKGVGGIREGDRVGGGVSRCKQTALRLSFNQPSRKLLKEQIQVKDLNKGRANRL